MKKTTFLLVISVLLPSAAAQEKTGIAVDPSQNNVAALFTMTDEGGRTRNLDLMESVFKDRSLGFTCERHHNVSTPYIYKRLSEIASELDEGATLLLYFNSHGGGSGDRFAMTAQGGSFKFSRALDALKKPNRMIRRLIFLVDTCHAEGGIQDSLKQDGELLRNIKTATPTSFLPEITDVYTPREKPFNSIFALKDGRVDFGEDSGVYEEILIISSSSVEDVSVRGAFALRFATTFKAVSGDRSVTVGQFLKKFADSHGKSGQQPHYKILPDKSMLNELLFGPWPAQTIPIRNFGDEGVFGPGFVPVPSVR